MPFCSGFAASGPGNTSMFCLTKMGVLADMEMRDPVSGPTIEIIGEQ